MAGFKNVSALVDSFDNGKTWISTFRKQPAASATIAGHWFDYSYAAGNPIPNYYASSPLVADVLDESKGIIVPRMAGDDKQFIHRITAMAAASSATSTTSQNQPLMLLDYLLYYPFIDMDAAGEDQTMDNTVTLPRYTDGVGVQMMVISQAPTIGGGRFTITYMDSDDNPQTTVSMYCAAAQPAGCGVQAVNAAGGLAAFVPLAAGSKGVKSVTSCNFSVANGGLCAIVLVKVLETHYVMEECRRTTTGTIESFGDATEKEAMRLRGGMAEIKDGAFLGFYGRGTAGSLASSVLVGTLETVWG